MSTTTPTDAQIWADHAEALADWSLARLVVRHDVFGAYKPDGNPWTPHEPLTRDRLVRHFRGEAVIGAHSTSADGKCKAVVFDIDAHDDQADKQANWRFALEIVKACARFGLKALIFDSNGKGGYHVRVFLKKPIPVEAACWFAQQVVADHAKHGFVKPPEHFPKQSRLTLECPYGNWVRLPGKHHKRDHWSRIFDPVASAMYAGEEAVKRLIRVAGDDPKAVLTAWNEQDHATRDDASTAKRTRTGSGRRSTHDKPEESTVRDALSHLGSGFYDPYDPWLAVGMALHDWDAGRGLTLWKEWSSQSSRYDAAVCDEKWSSFTQGGGLGVGTIFYDAEQRGWRPPWKQPTTDDKPHSNTNGKVEADRPNGIEPNEAVDDPHRLARLYRDERCTHDDGLTLAYHRDEWHRFDGAAYRVVPESQLRAELAETIKPEFDSRNVEAIEAWERRGRVDERGKACPCPTAKKVTHQLVGNVALNLTGMTLLDARTEQPSWLDGPAPFPAVEVLPARNCLVHLPSFVENRPNAVVPATPRFFSSWALDYDFQPAAGPPVEWLKFLRDLWPDDQQAAEALQEWFGYCLTPDTRQQKILAMIGPKRSGKGTIARVLTALVGAENTASPTLSGLGSHFGLAPMLGKPVAIISDARMSGRSDQAAIVENLLRISGEDSLTIDRKHVSAWTGKLPSRIVLIANELPRLSDSSGALAGRLILLRFTQSFFDKEDHGLTARLMAELPSILLWAVAGWERLNSRGRFVQPDSGRELVEDMEDLASPTGAFLRERCIVEPGQIVAADDLFHAWQNWCEANGRKFTGHLQDFGRDLRAVLPHLKTVQKRAEGRRRCYEGIGLKPFFDPI